MLPLFLERESKGTKLRKRFRKSRLTGVFMGNVGHTYPGRRQFPKLAKTPEQPTPSLRRRLAPPCSYLWGVSLLLFHLSELLLPRHPLSISCISCKNCFRTQVLIPTPEMRPWADQFTSPSLISQFGNGLRRTWSQQRRCQDNA